MSTAPEPAPIPRPLTPKQEKFAQLVASGMQQSEAARLAGYRKGVHNDLRRNTRVQARISALRDKAEARGEDPGLASVTEKRRFLAELIRRPAVDSEVKLADKLRAIELDSKLANHFLTKDDDTTPKPNAHGITLEQIQEIARRVKVVSPLLMGS